jgi:O-antigen ligase
MLSGDEQLPQTAPPPPEPYRYRPVELHRPHYWRAAFELIAERPLLGHGADRFRTAYRDHVPLEAWEPRARAHSVLLETAVDLGLLGLLVLSTFAALLAARIQRVVRSERAKPEQMAAAAAVVGFALHGLVDYFLAYTQIYVVAWPIVGILLGGGEHAAAVVQADDDAEDHAENDAEDHDD